MSEASEELLPDSAMASDLLSARGPPTLRKPEFEEVGTGSKIPKVDSPTKRYPPFSVGMVYEHNDEELPEPDLEPGEIWEDSEYGSDQEQDLFGDEDSGPPNLSEEEIRDLDRKAMVTEIDRLIAMQAVQRTALSEIEKEEKTEGEREERERTQEQSGLPPSLFLIGVLEKGNGFEEHVLLLESSRVRNTELTPSVRPQALPLYALYQFLGYNRNIPCTLLM